MSRKPATDRRKMTIFVPMDESDSSFESSSSSEIRESKGSMAKQEGKEGIGVKLEDEMNNDHLQKLQEIFEEADEDGGGGLDIDEFRGAMRKIMGEGMVDDRELAIVFMKVDANCDGTVDWDEYLSYMLLEYQERDHMSNLFKEIPFPKPLREISSNHRDTLTKVGFFQTVNLRHSSLSDDGEHGGRYISVSKEGVINIWSVEMNLIRSITLEQPREKTKPMWLTDMVCMPNVNMIAISSTERDISFYDVNATKWDRSFHVTGLEHCALTMDYWFDPKNMNRAVLVFGDAGGNVACFIFTEALGAALFGSQNAKSVGSRRVPFPEILKGNMNGVKAMKFAPLHEDWVRKVRYIPNLNSFVSCATTNETSIYIGDLDRKKTTSFFKIRKGIVCFDYDKETNCIVTGGMDRSVRVWNPYVTTKATAVMKGHTSAVTHIVVNSHHGQIISVGKDKGIKVWDMRDQTCLQNINPRSINLGPHAISTVCFHAKTGSLILGSNQLALLEHKWEAESEEDEAVSHAKPVTCALYNSLFNQVVSSCHDSVVSVWDLATGNKTIQFSKAHTYIEKGIEKSAEITAMTFDPSLRRLITGGRDGTVKVWNFNNGACLRELEVFDNLEITGIVCPKQRIVTTGWNRRIATYIDSDEDEDSRQWAVKHSEDVLSLAYYDSILATSSYDGEIWIWSLETAHPLCKLSANEGVKPQTGSHIVNLESDFVNKSAAKILDQNQNAIDDDLSKSSHHKNDHDSNDKLVSEHLKKMKISDDHITREGEQRETRKQSLTESQSLLPAINTSKRPSLVDKGPWEPNPSKESKTFFTESMSNFKKNIGEKEEEDEHKEEEKEDENEHDYSHDLDVALQEAGLLDNKHDSSVDKVLFLQSRPNDKDTATLMASGAEGWVRAWSIHHKGGLLGQFNAAHKPKESILTMATDSNNEFLITGDTMGYVKIWDISNYCIHQSGKSPTMEERETLAHEKAAREKQFSFLKGNTKLKELQGKVLEKAKTAFPKPPPQTCPEETLHWPPQLSSYRAHLKTITHVEYAEDKKLVITSSVDCSVRLWTLCGRYIGTFGQKRGWDTLPDTIIPNKFPRKMPRDVQRVASAMTLKVLNGGIQPKWRLARNIMMIVARNQGKQDDIEQDYQSGSQSYDADDASDEKRQESWGTSAILGKSYKPKTRHKMPPVLPEIKQNQSQVVVYSSLPFTDLEPVKEPEIPATLQEIQLRHQASNDAVDVPTGTKGKHGGAKRTRLHDFLQKQRAVRLMAKGRHAAQTKL
ncbi:WD repeat-containing protein on Y chromosome [Holothuria leucospilota]|uniref:WD repeat-containing protein on Y chromosome n=1 Tax=Holothuria leucospilota TaxID=206669 RepID=A0A9Q1CHF3_HOLLE|nr:WD repeat-containing protein on Y chromosome [Holothuria leucospilota]